MKEDILKVVKNALEEDVKSGDITTNSIVTENKLSKAKIITKEKGIIAGLEIAKYVFLQLDNNFEFINKVNDGAKVKKGQIVAELKGKTRAILTGERTALNFLQRLSGIATITNKLADRAKPAKILDTRKTVPGLRLLDKYAVKIGGGINHRFGLYDMVLIKNNHIDFIGSITKAVELARKSKKKIEIECRDIKEVIEAVNSKPDMIMLDNMNNEEMKKAVNYIKKINPKIKIEASGNINFRRIKSVASTGVDFISAGFITHSVKALDISLRANENH